MSCVALPENTKGIGEASTGKVFSHLPQNLFIRNPEYSQNLFTRNLENTQLFLVKTSENTQLLAKKKPYKDFPNIEVHVRLGIIYL